MDENSFIHLLANKIQTRDNRDTLTVLNSFRQIGSDLDSIIYKLERGGNIYSLGKIVLSMVNQLSLVLFYIGRTDGRYNLASIEKDYDDIVG